MLNVESKAGDSSVVEVLIVEGSPVKWNQIENAWLYIAGDFTIQMWKINKHWEIQQKIAAWLWFIVVALLYALNTGVTNL